MSFGDYIAHGWRLCAIEPRAPGATEGGKAPRYREWNARGLGQVTIPPGYGAGLMHAESGTCAIDIDQMEVASIWLATKNVSLASLLSAPDAVRISSGRMGRSKLLYRLATPLQSKKTAPFKALSPKSGKEETYTALDFRCATKDGLSLQDVLPPTIHPDTGRPYEWQYGDPLFGSWRNLPRLPAELRAVWEALVCDMHIADDAPTAPLGADFAEMRSLIALQDPNAAYDEWLRVGMAIHHETGGSRDGLLLWNEWSAQAAGPGKYKGLADLEVHWRSFSSTVAGAVTLGSLRAEAVAGVGDFPVVPPSTKAAAPTGQFQVLDGEDLENAPPMEWIVDKLIPDAALGAVYGPTGAGKSSWVLDLVMHIAAGIPWRSLPVKQRRALYIMGEGVGGMRGADGRYGRARRKLDLERVPVHFITNRAPNLTNATDAPEIAELLRAARETPCGLVIFDTLAQMTPGADENSGKDMGVAIKHCQMLHEATGAMVLLIAHSGKDEARGIRGWSGIKGALDVEIEVTERTEGIHVAEITKMRDGERGAEFPFRLDAGLVEHTDEIPRAKARRSADPTSAVFHTICTEKLGIGGESAVDIEDVITEMLQRLHVPPGEAEALRKMYGRKIVGFCLPTDSLFVFNKGVISVREMTGFELRPVGAAGIDTPTVDTAPAAVDDQSNFLGIL